MIQLQCSLYRNIQELAEEPDLKQAGPQNVGVVQVWTSVTGVCSNLQSTPGGLPEGQLLFLTLPRTRAEYFTVCTPNPIHYIT